MSKFTTIAGAVLVIGALFKPATHYFTMENLSGVVIAEKERVATKDGSRFMIWTTDETFENTDTWLSWKFNSADVYGKMVVGQTCDMRVNGWRVPFLSWNRNIIEANCS
ncbi:hypothetical protein PXK56_18420 [Phaeobacter gallaeciensis]|uniref:hypothetical protein n=1 Tax=Phaeobacter gallaeciensis TaxID=60890 RepID=UPI0023808A3C|nr:hypothetical protein [Phaeobacter gallaeciensis]MDE4297163.1 hypothetical protein [Phaeobacter gallaeciensis]